jgi:hypothetical protein
MSILGAGLGVYRRWSESLSQHYIQTPKATYKVRIAADMDWLEGLHSDFCHEEMQKLAYLHTPQTNKEHTISDMLRGRG